MNEDNLAAACDRTDIAGGEEPRGRLEQGQFDLFPKCAGGYSALHRDGGFED